MSENKDSIAEWLRFSDMDRQYAIHGFETMYPKPLELICFHCQQACEKALKAIIILHGEMPEKTHDMDKIIKKIKTWYDVPEALIVKSRSLTKYATTMRYPDSPENR